MTEVISKEFVTKGASADGAIEAAEAALGIAFPDDYRLFLARFGGGEGFVGEHYLVLWTPTELAPFNRDYEIAEYAPGLVAIGSDGGGEGFAFDTRSLPHPIVMVPFIGMSLTDAKPVAATLSDFMERMRSSSESLLS